MLVTFGEYVLDQPARELRRKGQRVHLQPRVFDLLTHLVTHRQRVVSVEELLSDVWGSVVTAGVVTTALRQLRLALGDDARSPKVIRTVHRKGYRFIAEIQTRGLAEARHAHFVGRNEELAALDHFAAGDVPVCLVTGMQGIGKSALLDEWSFHLGQRGQDVVQLSGAQLSPVPRVLRARIEEELALASSDAVVIIDEFEALEAIDDWFRRVALPFIGPRKIVLCTHQRPRLAWHADASAGLVETLEVKGLREPVGTEILVRAGCDPNVAGRLWHLVEGHPLSLGLLAGVSPEAWEQFANTSTIELPELTSAFSAVAPTEEHRRALDVAALVPTLSLPYLEAVIGEPASQIFEWLERLLFVTSTPRGLHMQGAVAAALLARLSTSNPGRLSELLQKALRYAVTLMRDADDVHESSVFSAMAMNLVRVHPFFAGLYDPAADALDLSLSDDFEPLLPIIQSELGDEALEVLSRWLERDESTCWLVRDVDRVVGGVVVLTLREAIDEDFDPGMASVREHLDAVGRSDRPVIVHRAFVGPGADVPGPVLQRCHDVCNMQHHAMEGAFRDSFMMYRHTEHWAPLALSMNFEQAPSFMVGPHTYGAFHRSFDEGSLAWFEKVLTELSR